MLLDEVGCAFLYVFYGFDVFRRDFAIGKKLPGHEGGEEEESDFERFFKQEADQKSGEEAQRQIADGDGQGGI